MISNKTEGIVYEIANTRGGHAVGYGLLEEFLAAWRAQMANRLIPASYRNGSLLDIGCGAFPMFLLKTPFAQKHGLDRFISEQDVERYRYRKVTLHIHDLQQDGILPFQDDTFAAVTLLAVFEHLHPPSLLDLLQEIRRVLRPGGLYIMTTPAPWTGNLLKVLAAFRLISAHGVEEHQDVYSYKKICTYLSEAGFSKNQVRCGHFEWFMNTWVVARK